MKNDHLCTNVPSIDEELEKLFPGTTRAQRDATVKDYDKRGLNIRQEIQREKDRRSFERAQRGLDL